MTDLSCDVAVIGAGTAGLAAERSARREGARTMLIDPAFAGTTCARTGCMPSKLVIAAGRAAHAVRSAPEFGVRTPAPEVDGVAVMARVRALRDDFVAATRGEIEKLTAGVAVRATARFAGPATLALSDGRRVRARAVVIATGARPTVPEPFAPVRDRLLTHETVFDMADLPATLAVVGAGPLGLELAQGFARLGVAVTLLDQGAALAGLDDEPEVAACLRGVLAGDMAIHLGVEIAAEPDGDGVRLRWTGGDGGGGNARFDRLLVAAGRAPALAELDLAAAGLALDDHGTPVFDRDTMQCGDAPVFLCGDADHDRPVLHEASQEGAIAGRNAGQYPSVTPARRCTPFSVMFTEPGLALVGTRGEGDGVVVGTASYADQGRARVDAENRGLVRLYADREGGRLRGATVLAPAAEHLGHLLAWSIEQGLSATEMLDRPFYHPTYEEGLKPALRAICAAAGTTPPADRDQGNPAGG